MNKKGKKQPDDFDILGKLNIGNAMDVDLNDPALMKELKGMGWDDDEEDMDIDPELADLEKQIEEEEEFEVPHGREMTAEEIENAKFDEDDLNDPDLEAELDEAEGRENDPALQASLRIDHLEKEIELAKAMALKEKANNNKEKALEYLKAMKSYEAELNSTKQLLSMHKITQKEKKKRDTDPPEDFDFSSIVSMSVLEYEKEQALKGKKKDIVETCDMQIDILTNNINLGIVSQEQYIESLQLKVQEYEDLCKGPNKGFFLKHVQLMNQELQEAAEAEEEEEQGEQEEVVEEVVRQPSVKKPLQPVPVDPVPKPKVEDNHEELMKNIKYRTVFESFDEGKLAFQYLKNIGQTSLAEKILDRLEGWQKILHAIKSGKEFKSEIKPLSPIDLIGIPEESRRQKFAQLIKFTIDHAAQSKEKALAALKQKDKDQAAIYKREMMSYEQKGQIMEQAMKNPWQAPPNVTVRSIVKSVPVIHEDLEACALEVSYGSASGFSDSEDYFITYSMVAGDTLSGSTEKFSKVNTKGINHTFLIKVDQRNFSSLFKKHIIFEVFEYHRIRSNKSQGTCNIKLEQLAKQSTWTTNIQLARKGPSIVVTFRVQKALVAAEMKQITENLEVVEDLIPPFKSFEGLVLQRKQEVVENNTNPPGPVAKAPEESKQELGGFEDVGQDEYDNPNVARNLVSFEVLELEIERLKGVIIELRSNGKNADGFMNLQRELMRNKSIIEAQVGNGVITPEQYKDVLEKQVEHDMRLAGFYKQRGKKQHLETVLRRVQIMKKEIVELANADE